jgi:alpha-glucosidase
VTAKGRSLVYQVFVDRFASDKGALRQSGGGDPWRVHAGGTLDGVIHRLEHLTALGADALYLTPIFSAPSNHKYDTWSFDEVDPIFGGDGAFDRLVAACRERNIGIILDGVFNHVGETHPWFAGPEKRDWFVRSERGVTGWRGMGWLPELDLGNSELLSALIEGPDSVGRRWLKRGATRWRLDCAKDLGVSVCDRIRRVAAEEGARDGVIGEIMSYGARWGDALDGVMNYYFRETVVSLLEGRATGEQAAYNFERMAAEYRPLALERSWNVLGSHDTPRLRSLVPSLAARQLAYTLAFAFPGTPLVYYGDEVGMEGGADPHNRAPMAWEASRWEQPLFAHLQKLGALRRSRVALERGALLPLPQPGNKALIAFARTHEHPTDTVLLIANGSDQPLSARAWVPHSFLFDGVPLRDLLGGPSLKLTSDRIDIELAPFQAALLQPDDSTIIGYSFWKR